jgi:hypothetical protein
MGGDQGACRPNAVPHTSTSSTTALLAALPATTGSQRVRTARAGSGDISTRSPPTPNPNPPTPRPGRRSGARRTSWAGTTATPATAAGCRASTAPPRCSTSSSRSPSSPSSWTRCGPWPQVGGGAAAGALRCARGLRPVPCPAPAPREPELCPPLTAAAPGKHPPGPPPPGPHPPHPHPPCTGKVEIGAFRTYPEGYKPPDEGPSEYQTIPLSKIEDFGEAAAGPRSGQPDSPRSCWSPVKPGWLAGLQMGHSNALQRVWRLGPPLPGYGGGAGWQHAPALGGASGGPAQQGRGGAVQAAGWAWPARPPAGRRPAGGAPAPPAAAQGLPPAPAPPAPTPTPLPGIR